MPPGQVAAAGTDPQPPATEPVAEELEDVDGLFGSMGDIDMANFSPPWRRMIWPQGSHPPTHSLCSCSYTYLGACSCWSCSGSEWAQGSGKGEDWFPETSSKDKLGQHVLGHQASGQLGPANQRCRSLYLRTRVLAPGASLV